jgi:hypothetical protein
MGSWMLFLIALATSLTVARCEYIREFEISEGVSLGTTIGLIGESNPGVPRPPPPPYLIVPVPGSAVDSDLNIEQSTGEIRTKVVLDRELRSSYSLVAIPLSGENIRVLVTVKDENDNAPTFPNPLLQIWIWIYSTHSATTSFQATPTTPLGCRHIANATGFSIWTCRSTAFWIAKRRHSIV